MTATRPVIQPIGAQNPINRSLSYAYTFCRRSFARFLNPGYAQAAMNSVVDTIVAGPVSADASSTSRNPTGRIETGLLRRRRAPVRALPPRGFERAGR